MKTSILLAAILGSGPVFGDYINKICPQLGPAADALCQQVQADASAGVTGARLVRVTRCLYEVYTYYIYRMAREVAAYSTSSLTRTTTMETAQVVPLKGQRPVNRLVESLCGRPPYDLLYKHYRVSHRFGRGKGASKMIGLSNHLSGSRMTNAPVRGYSPGTGAAWP
jgi:hypothetical protein